MTVKQLPIFATFHKDTVITIAIASDNTLYVSGNFSTKTACGPITNSIAKGTVLTGQH
jgi:hypothetical protein